MNNVSHNKGTTLPPSVLSPRDVQLLLDSFNPRWFSSFRDRTALVIMWRSQLRSQEVCDLEPGDIDHENGTITVRSGKGKKFRVVGMDAQTSLHIREWLEFCEQHGFQSTCGRLFFTHSGKPLKTKQLRRTIKRKAAKAGIKRRVHCHGLRHTGACELSREGVSLPIISAQLGHNSLVTTHRYLQRIAPQEVIAQIRRRIWKEPTANK